MIPITCNAVGDILALATLVLDITHALNESRGSPAKYRALNSELKSLHIVLASVAAEVDRCGSEVRSARERIARFSDLGRDASSEDVIRIRIKRQWYKLKWLKFGGNVESIREEIARATQRLTIYLVTSHADDIHNLGVSIQGQFNAMSARMCMSLMRQFSSPAQSSSAVPGTSLDKIDSSKAAAAALLCVAMCTMHDAPQAVQHGLLLLVFAILMSGMVRDQYDVVPVVQYTHSNSVLLDDAMGRQLVLPIELCATSELLHATLVNLFSPTSGSWFINSRKYMITSTGEGGYRQQWRDLMDGLQCIPGDKLEMVIFMSSDSNGVGCPICPLSGVTEKPQVIEIKNHGHETSYCTHCERTMICDFYDYPLFRHSPEFDDSRVVFPLANPKTSPRYRTTGSETTLLKAGTFLLNSQPSVDKAVSVAASHPHLDWYSQIHPFTRIQVRVMWSITGYSREYQIDLHLAARNGHYDMVNGLLAGGLDVNVADPSGHTALHAASVGGHISIVDLLLEYGAIINAVAEDSMTPLACALGYENTDVAELLVSRDALSGLSMPSQANLLYYAAQSGHIRVVRILLSLGTDVNTRAGASGVTALHAACDKDDVFSPRRQTIRVLLQNGADISARSEYGDTPLSIAMAAGRHELFRLLIPPERMDEVTLNWSAWWPRGGLGLLQAAVKSGNHQLIASLLQTGIDVNSRPLYGHTPLALAAGTPMGHETVKLLLERGAGVNISTLYGNTPLFLALNEAQKRLNWFKTWGNEWCRSEAEDYQRKADLLLAWGAVPDEKSSMLLRGESIQTGRSPDNFADADIPGAWREDS
ncbi:unnamed protein product [Peniophora sp. CBMAI 1063]|nr:unnamed protein product [Peniophora sp. CBMAI 1063]